MNYIIYAILFLIFLYWYFNKKPQPIMEVNVPIEKMSNISVFNNDEI